MKPANKNNTLHAESKQALQESTYVKHKPNTKFHWQSLLGTPAASSNQVEQYFKKARQNGSAWQRKKSEQWLAWWIS